MKTKLDVLGKICDRAINRGLTPPNKRMRLVVDMERACEEFDLDLDKLLAFDDFNFAHDIIEIQRHIDRTTKQFKNCFVPRASRGDAK